MRTTIPQGRFLPQICASLDGSCAPNNIGRAMQIMPSPIRQAFQVLILLLSIACVVGWGQTFQGSFTGTVMDPSGAVVPGTLVTVTEKDKGFSRSVTTSNDGSYEIPLLPPGRYVLGAQKIGFRNFQRGPLTLLVNQHLREDITLNVGSTAVVVSVEAYPETVESQT